ncbi:MAG: hypothetical protein ABL994_10370 [Verrucomicrobiales bacterium]
MQSYSASLGWPRAGGAPEAGLDVHLVGEIEISSFKETLIGIRIADLTKHVVERFVLKDTV